MLQNLARLPPRRPAEFEKCVQRIRRENLLVLKFRRREMPLLLQHREVEHLIADRHAHARRATLRLENAKRQILNREMRVGRDVDEGAEWT